MFSKRENTFQSSIPKSPRPFRCGTAVSLGFSPIHVAVGIALASSLGFMMPVSTPPNAIVYASGYVPITKMIKSGFIIDLIGVFCITIPIVLIIVKAVMGGDGALSLK